MSPELISIELARLVETSSAWMKRFERYDQLQDAGLSCEEAAIVVTRAYQADLSGDLRKAIEAKDRKREVA